VCTDPTKRTFWDHLRQRDLTAFARWLSPAVCAAAAHRAGVALGAGPLHRGNLVWLAVAGALHPAKPFADVLGLVLKLLRDAPGWHATPAAAAARRGRRRARARRRRPHDPRGHDPAAVSEEAFVQARRRLPWGFGAALLALLGERFEAEHADVVRWRGFRLLALDGTTLGLPRWRRLAEYFGTAANGQAGRTTQARLVMLQLPSARLPWRYELAPLSEGERTLAGRLLGDVRARDLVLMDRGFWSYGLFCQVRDRAADFAIRQVAGVGFHTLRRLGRDDRLVRWEPSDRPWRRAGLPAATVVRVVTYQVRGFRPGAVVTSVLDPAVVSRAEWVRLAAVDEAGRVLEPGLYHRRWEIETSFAELKATQGLEGGLRSRTPEGVRYEVAGHVLLYLLVRWLMVEAARAHGVEDPLRLRFAGALAERADLREALLHASAARAQRVLLPRLRARIARRRVPYRPGRHYPRPPDTKVKNKGKGKYQQPSKITNTGT
jgi:Transposase DDE domain